MDYRNEELNSLFEEYDTDLIIVYDFNIVVNNMMVTHIEKTDNGIQLWSGDPYYDHDSEEILVDDSNYKKVIDEILNLM